MVRAARGRRGGAVVAGVLLCSLADVAGAAPAVPAHDRPSFGSPGVVRSIEKLPHGPAFLEQVDEMRGRDACECDSAYPVGDVDGDGTDDVLHARYTTSPAYATELAILDGRTGEPLFRAPVEVPGWAYATGADLGPHGAGIFYLSSSFAGWPEDSLTIGAIDRRGISLWRRRWDRVTHWVPNASAALGVHSVEVFEEGGGPTDLVVATTKSAYSLKTSSVVALERISGVTGATVELGTYVTDGVDEVAVDAVRGVSGPRAIDFVVQTSTYAADDVTMELRHDVSSDPAWSIPLRPPWGFLHVPDSADVVGDERAELLVQQARPLRLAALDGATGETSWSAGGYADAIVPGERGADVLMGDTTVHRDGTIVHDVLRTGARSGWSWERSFAYSGRFHHSPWGWGWSYSVGDATGDGAADVRVDVELLDDDGDSLWIRGSRQHLVDGRTGDVVRAGSTYFPLEGSFTGATSDAVEFHRRARGLSVSGLDGGSGDVLWTTRLPVDPRSKPCTWGVEVVRTETGPDLLFLDLPGGAGDVELVLDGASGELLWSS
ncbi:MAG TPA: hypothetical protein VHN37_10695 [Actinomycetota bacterium]|nr:hypothetical protein [Actinomycetota bacterium]